jgi:hypothetical protein
MPQIKEGIEDVSRAYELYIVTSVFLAATVITTAARIGTKLAFRVRLGIDDWLIILGSVCDNKMKNKNIALTDIKALNVVADAFDYKATASGFGRHAMFLSEDELIQAAKYSQLAVGIAIWAIGIIKLSVCFFLLNLIRGTHKRFRWGIYGMIVLNVSFSLVGAILWGTQARPLARLWDPRIPGTVNSAQEFLVMVYIVYAYGCFTDILYALSPVYFLWSVQLKWNKKLPIMLITGCAVLYVFASPSL